MELTVYTLDGHPIDIRPAPLERDWMDASKERFAYRCLPLNIANAHGWEMLVPIGFQAVWNGTKDLNAISVIADGGKDAPAASHFGMGVLTFNVNCLFRTEPEYDLLVQGPVNQPKDAISALTGIIETDWAPYTFTMNWMFTRAGAVVRFEEGEPFCHVYPIRRGEVEEFTPRLIPIADEPGIKQQLNAWEISRNKFIEDLKVPGSDADKEKWQKLYYRGLDAEGNLVKAVDHRTKVKVKPFEK